MVRFFLKSKGVVQYFATKGGKSTEKVTTVSISDTALSHSAWWFPEKNTHQKVAVEKIFASCVVMLHNSTFLFCVMVNLQVTTCPTVLGLSNRY